MVEWSKRMSHWWKKKQNNKEIIHGPSYDRMGIEEAGIRDGVGV